MRAQTKCKKCGWGFQVISEYRICKNLGCTEYNKKFGKKLSKKEEEE